MDIFDDRNVSKLQFYQALFNSIESKESVTRKELNVDETEKACVGKEEVHAEVLNEEEVHSKVLNEEEVHSKVLNEEAEKTPLADIGAPTELDNSCKESTDLVRDDERVEAWLTALLKDYPVSKEESLPPVATINTNWDNDSGDEDETTQNLEGGTNPFRIASLDGEPVEEVVVSGDNDVEGCSAEWQMENFMQRIQGRAAVPQYALSDAIFWLDKPKDAVSLHDKLPVKPLSEDYKVDGIYKIVVTEIYSPFQFWFHICDDSNVLENLCQQLSKFYSSLEAARWQLPGYLQKMGYLCAVYYEPVWRRGRILDEPAKATEEQLVSVYLLDYGSCVNVPCDQLYFLHKLFIEQPALVQRGTLTDVYPLDLHWPPDATAGFKRLVDTYELHALIKEIDVQERTYFVSLSHSQDFSKSISTILVDADLAGLSHNYSEQVRDIHCGRRLRYVREQLPTFDMLETNVFPHPAPEFEKKFDDIVYMPDFFQNFQPPKLSNPFQNGLREALIAWLHRFKPIELEWRQLIEQRRADLAKQQDERVERYLKDLTL